MNTNNTEKRPKATKELAEHLDFINAEMDRLRNVDTLDADRQLQHLYKEREELISKYDWFDEVFEKNGKKGLKDVKGNIVVPAIYDDYSSVPSYAYRCLPAVAIQDGKMGMVECDGKGTPRSAFEFTRIENIPATAVDVVTKAGDEEHFALMIMGTVITPFELTKYYMPYNGCFIVRGDNNKVGIFDFMRLIYISPEYDEIYGGCVGEDFVFVKDGVEGWVTLDKRFVSKEEYHNMSEDEQDDLLDGGFICSVDDF